MGNVHLSTDSPAALNAESDSASAGTGLSRPFVQRNGFAYRRFRILADGIEVREGLLNRVEYRVAFTAMSEQPVRRTVYSGAWLTLTIIALLLLLIFVISYASGADTDPLLGGLAIYGGVMSFTGFFLWMSWGRTLEFPAGERSLAFWLDRPSREAVQAFAGSVVRARRRYLAGLLDRHAAPVAPVARPAVPDSLDARLARALGPNYSLLRVVGKGGFGIVFQAHDHLLDRMLAVKVLRDQLTDSDESRGRFLREARILARLQHRNILPVHFVNEAEGLVFIAMPYVDGASVRGLLETQRRFPPSEVARILAASADGLNAAHQAGIVHRDVKPENVMIDGATHQVLVMDFGIAKPLGAASARLTSTGAIIGSPAYMSPEQAHGVQDLDARSDIYSLGIMGYEMVVGDVPFRAASYMALAHAHVSQPPPPISADLGVPAELTSAIARCLSKRPEDRWQSAGELAEQVRPLIL